MISYVYAGTPVWISHYSVDGAWAFVECADKSAGFVPTTCLAHMSDRDIQKMQSATLCVWIKDDHPITLCGKGMWNVSRIGAPAWVIKKGQNVCQILCPIRHLSGCVQWVVLKVPTSLLSLGIMDKQKFSSILKSFLSDVYAWGGSATGRDCSMMVRDYFSILGYGIPRNSLAQSQDSFAQVIALEGLHRTEKKKKILAKGVPFRTAVYWPGHIVLYVGQKQGQPLFLHNAWGSAIECQDGKVGRNIVGGCVLSTLEYGKNLCRKNDWLDRAASLHILQ